MVQIYGNKLTDNRGKSIGIFTQISTDNNCHTLISAVDRSVEVPFKLLSKDDWKNGKGKDYISKHVQDINKALREKMDCSEQIDLGEYAGTMLVQFLMRVDLDKIDTMKQLFGQKK